jgi:hypothetical protein
MSNPIASLGPVYHMGYVVADVDAAAQTWAATANVGPFFVFRDFAFEQPNYRGRAAGPKVTLAFGASGDLCIELIQQQDDVPSPYHETGPGLHHIGVFEKDVASRSRQFANQGIAQIFYGAFSMGGCCAYLDTRKQLGCLLEIVEDHPILRGMIEQIRAAHRSWDRRSAFASL